ncbi:MAG: trypsin-like peptidase domain-containing protein [Candidatus Rokubacteria bacterium]|nr:trypsin-like peptidase domain-containing protein [Candidatus Rokubacteria bacterium]
MRLFSLVLAVTTAVALGLPADAPAQTVGDVFRKVNVSVVVIRAKGRDVTASGRVQFSEIGSGVLISADGRVMTAAHVVHAADEITVELASGETVAAQVIASEPAADLSLVKLERVPPGAVVAPMANSDTVRVGDQVVVVGAPYGLAYSMTVGWISARWPPNTVYREMPLAEFFQTDAVINTGNSGGPMFNMAGEVIGVVSHNISKSGGSEGLGFVVTINTAKKLLLEHRSFWTGLEGRLLTQGLADILNLPPNALGYLVKTVAAGSPAEMLGLRGGQTVAVIDGEPIVVGGDVILKVQGIAVTDFASYERIRDALAGLARGAPVAVTILRAGTVMDLSARLP